MNTLIIHSRPWVHFYDLTEWMSQWILYIFHIYPKGNIVYYLDTYIRQRPWFINMSQEMWTLQECQETVDNYHKKKILSSVYIKISKNVSKQFIKSKSLLGTDMKQSNETEPYFIKSWLWGFLSLNHSKLMENRELLRSGHRVKIHQKLKWEFMNLTSIDTHFG